MRLLFSLPLGALLMSAATGCAGHRPAVSTALSRDETVDVSGAAAVTLNQVVPMPETDLIRVGAFQEGTLYRFDVRTAAQEAATHGGGVGANGYIIIRVVRP